MSNKKKGAMKGVAEAKDSGSSNKPADASESSGGQPTAARAARKEALPAAEAYDAFVGGGGGGGGSMAPPQLRGEQDYPAWKKSMQALLEWQGLWTVVQHAPPKGSSGSGRSVIQATHADDEDDDEVASVEDADSDSSSDEVAENKKKKEHRRLQRQRRAYVVLLLAIQKCEEASSITFDVPQGNPHELWSRLEHHYESLTEASKSHLLTEFNSSRMRPGEGLALFIARIKKTVMALEAVNIRIAKEQVNFQFLNGLEQPKYDIARQMVSGMGAVSQWSFDRLCSHLRAQEVELGSKNKAKSGQSPASSSGKPTAANFVANKNFKQKPGGSGGGAKGACFVCGKEGHRAFDCKKKFGAGGSSSSSGGGSSSSKFCTYCGMDGHDVGDCRTKKRADERNASAASSSSNGSSSKPKASLGAQVARDRDVEKANVARIIVAKDESSPSKALAAESKQVEPAGDVWHLDSGAARNNGMPSVPVENASTNHGVRIKVASGDILSAPLEGELTINTALADRPLHLKSVLVHERMGANLLSVSETCASPAVAGVWFDLHRAQVITTEGEVLLEARQEDGVYIVDGCSYGDKDRYDFGGEMHPSFLSMVKALAAANGQNEKVQLWHSRLGHMGHTSMRRLQASKVVDDLDIQITEHAEVCDGCMKGKMSRGVLGKGHPPGWHRAKQPMDRFHSDTIGPFPPTLGGKRFLVLITDEWSDHTSGATVKAKSDIAAFVQEECLASATVHGRPLKEFHSDGGGEFVSNELAEFFAKQGTKQTLTMPATPQHNGRAERKGRTIMEATRSMLELSHGPMELWGEAALTAIYIRNLVGVKDGQQKTANQLWHTDPTMKESIQHLRVWGCDAWVHIPEGMRTKLDPRARKCVFIGYDGSGHGYRFYDVDRGMVIRSRDAEFEETKFTQCAELKRILSTAPDGTPVGTETEAQFYDDLETLLNDSNLQLGIMLSNEEAAKNTASAVGVTPSNQNNSPVEEDGQGPSSSQVSSGSAPASSTSPAPAPAPARHTAVPVPMKEFSFDDSESSSSGGSDEDYEAMEDEAPAGAIRRSARPRKPTNHFGMANFKDIGQFLAAMLTRSEAAKQAARQSGLGLADPTTLDEAKGAPDSAAWEKGIEAEHQSLTEKGVMVEVERLPKGKKAIRTKYVFRRKTDLEGFVARHKVRMVGLGFNQKPGIDFTETYTPTLHSTSTKVFLAAVTTLDLDFVQMDVETAFLNATLKEEVYITLPRGAKGALKPNGEPRLFRLNKALYGLRQAPREWNEEFNETLVKKCGFRRMTADQCIYTRGTKTGNQILLGVFVDDILFASDRRDCKEAEEIKNTLKQTYKMSDLGDAKLLLGMRIQRDRVKRTLTLDQEAYINKLLEQTGMTNCTPASTPEEPGSHLVKARDDEPAPTNKQLAEAMGVDENEPNLHTTFVTSYGSMVGAILYAAVTSRVDIQHAASQVSRFVSCPTLLHWHACKRILRYLKGTSTLGLTFHGATPGTDPFTLGPVFADANWAGDLDDRKSTTGVLVKINGCAVAWRSQKQKSVATSSAEAEYMALGDATKEVLWLRQLLKEMGFTQDSTLMLGDNEAANITAKNDSHHTRMKHIDIKHHFIREHIEAKHILIHWVPTAKQQADLLTKAVGRNIFEELRAKAMGHRGNDSGEHQGEHTTKATRA
jgi:hypothetical protein